MILKKPFFLLDYMLDVALELIGIAGLVILAGSESAVVYEKVLDMGEFQDMESAGVFRFEFRNLTDTSGTPLGSPGFCDPQMKKQHVDRLKFESDLESGDFLLVETSKGIDRLSQKVREIVQRLLRLRLQGFRFQMHMLRDF